MEKAKSIIVSNRLPVKALVSEDSGELRWESSEGGLATGLASVYREGNSIWIGWPGITDVVDEKIPQIDAELAGKNLVPVFLTLEEVDGYYEGFSNETIWPLFHYFPSYAKFDQTHWEIYKSVNEKFAGVVLAHANPGDTIWIQDYHLLLLPELIRNRRPGVTIGFFQHIPFPSFELFRNIPWRDVLIRGLLGADLIGFHTFDDVRHFISTSVRLLGLKAQSNIVYLEERMIEVDAFPMGIDFKFFDELTQEDPTLQNIEELEIMLNGRKLILSIDRLDYSKGILDRLEAYSSFLGNHPEWIEQVIFIQIVVPSRDQVVQYANLKIEIEQKVGEINGKFAQMGWQPVHYFYKSYPVEMLSALYSIADVGLVSPIRDGMNLVSKEYVASKRDRSGVLILSEMAGAAKELYEAMIINPRDLQTTSEAIFQALTMPADEQRRRMDSMRNIVEQFDVYRWVKNFMSSLQNIKTKQANMLTRQVTRGTIQKIGKEYTEAGNRILFLDYDGTLTPFQKDPERATPDSGLYQLLGELTEDNANCVVLISGRKKEFLNKWFGHLPVDLIAEHGVWRRERGSSWREYGNLDAGWISLVRPLLNSFVERTPGALIEEKSYSLAWHYRNVDPDLADQRVYEMVSNLKYITDEHHLQILQGDKVVEVKTSSINKGIAAKELLTRSDFDFVLAIGDDFTDEDTFRAMPEEAFTIKVGSGLSAAEYSLKSTDAVRSLLSGLTTSVLNR